MVTIIKAKGLSLFTAAHNTNTCGANLNMFGTNINTFGTNMNIQLYNLVSLYRRT